MKHRSTRSAGFTGRIGDGSGCSLVVDPSPDWVRQGVQVVVPMFCPVDQALHIADAIRCVEIVKHEAVQLVVTLACGCPLIAVGLPL